MAVIGKMVKVPVKQAYRVIIDSLVMTCCYGKMCIPQMVIINLLVIALVAAVLV